MPDAESALRDALATYRERVAPVEIESTVGVLLTGSLPTGLADEYSDVDLTLIFDRDPAEAADANLRDRLVPDGATVQRADAGEKYCFDWRDAHFDLLCVALDGLSGREWNLETRWEYDQAEVLADPDGRVARLLDAKLAFPRGERAAFVEEYAAEFHWTVNWDVHKWCARGRPHEAQHLLTAALDDLLALCYLRDGEFVPREKWLVRRLETLPSTDGETTRRVREATRTVEMDTADVRRRVRAMKAVWDGLRRGLDARGLLNADELRWENDEILRK